jgi:acyl-CoA synthetase (AMP-forming)/AMP-acid ligase II
MDAIKKRFLELQNDLTSDGKAIHANHILKRASEKWPEQIALICNDQKITYQKLFQTTMELMHKLHSYNIKPGDRVLIIYENSINFYKAYYAIWQMGAIVTPLNVYLHERELEHIIKDSQPTLIIASEKQKEKLHKLPEKVTIPIISEELFDQTTENHKKNFAITEQDQNSCTV